MILTEKQLRKIIRSAINESTSQIDWMAIQDLRLNLGAYRGTFRDFGGFADWYEDLMIQFVEDYGPEAKAFLNQFDLMYCTETWKEFSDKLRDKTVQSHPMFLNWTDFLRKNKF